MKDLYEKMGVRPQVYDFGKKIEQGLEERFKKLDETADYNQLMVLSAMQKNRVDED